MLYPCPDTPSLDCDGNYSWAQEISSAHERSEHSGSEWLQGWLDDTRPGQVFGLIGGHSWTEKGMRKALNLKALTHEILSPKITEEAERAIFGIVLHHPVALARSQEHMNASDCMIVGIVTSLMPWSILSEKKRT